MKNLMASLVLLFIAVATEAQQKSWIRVNLAGYTPQVPKAAVLVYAREIHRQKSVNWFRRKPEKRW